MQRLYQVRHPKDASNSRSHLLTDLLDIAGRSQQDAVDKAIEMLKDLRLNGRSSRFLKHEVGPIFELKSRTDDGGIRVYVFRVGDNAWAMCRAECKKEDKADQNLLIWCAEAVEARRAGKDILF